MASTRNTKINTNIITDVVVPSDAIYNNKLSDNNYTQQISNENIIYWLDLNTRKANLVPSSKISIPSNSLKVESVSITTHLLINDIWRFNDTFIDHAYIDDA